MERRASSTSWPHAHLHRAIMAAHVSCIRSSIYPLYVSSHLPFSTPFPLLPSLVHSSAPQEGEMLLEASATVALLSASSEASNPPYRAAIVAAGGHPLFSASFVSFRSLRRRAPVAAVVSGNALSGIVFQPFEEIKKDIYLVPTALDRSIARQKYADECEAAVNEQINVEYNNSYIYHALFAYFDRDNVALKGLAKFFEDSSEEEREHAEKLMEYQNKRGGKVKLQTIAAPLSEFDHPEKGDALYAMELALALEKLTNEKLLNLHSVADNSNDAQLADFIESEFLEEQVESVKKISEYVAQLRRVGKGHGVWHFDQMLLHEGGAA